MLDAERMKLVFRLGGVGFSLPVDHLVEIRQGPAGWIDREAADTETGLLGHVHQLNGTLPVINLCRCIGLSDSRLLDDLTLLVLPGRMGHLGVVVDVVEGFFPADEFAPLALPPLLEGRVPPAYGGFDMWRSELLIAGDASRWEPRS